MRFKTDMVAVVAVALMAVIIAGEYFTYGAEVDRGSDAEWDASSVKYSISSGGSDFYSAVLTGAGAYKVPERFFIYVDDTYSQFYDDACDRMEREGVSPYRINQKEAAEQIEKNLAFRGIRHVNTISSGGLRTLLESGYDFGLVVTSYALPSSVYAGSADDLFVQWIKAGGAVYWLGSEMGRFYVDGKRLGEVAGFEELFFGKSGVMCREDEIADEKVDAFTDALRLKNTGALFGLRGVGHGFGYSYGGYCSATLLRFGAGMIGVFSGGDQYEPLDDLGQVIASGLTYDSELLDYRTGSVVRGTVHGEMECGSKDATLYIFMGGTYQHYGKRYHAA